mmetsp:Transcript_2530/g.4902  ORF Transcript_2530/g.4902 Transcript_2530/m.4902 type:complete len:380 (+) Transcript_2530:362-1501(+)
MNVLKRSRALLARAYSPRAGCRGAVAVSQNKVDVQLSAKDEPVSGKSRHLVDSFGRVHDYLRISLTERCNLRCTYCMPKEGIELSPENQLLSDNELVKVAEAFVANGVDKIRLTGGEPLVRKNIVSLCERFKALGIRDLAITTNGILLKRHLEPLHAVGLNLLNISLDTLVPAKFELITRRRGFKQVLDSIHKAAVLPGLDRVKVNCVVKRGLNDDELIDFVALTKDLPIEIRFIEYMPFEGNRWNSKALLPYFEMVDRIKEEYPGFDRARSLDQKNTVSKTWRVPGFTGTVGFISSMSDHFCGSCNRLRLTADGQLKVCLFGEEEVSLRDVVRQGASESELTEVIRSTLSRKHEKLGGHEDPESIAKGINRPMILIGG